MATDKKNKIEYVEMTTEEVQKNLAFIIDNKIPLQRKRKDGTHSFIPPTEFDLYLKDRDMAFFIDSESLNKIRNAAIEIAENDIYDISENKFYFDDATAEESLIDQNYIKQLDRARGMDITERIKQVLAHNLRINDFIKDREKFIPKIIKEIGDIFSETLCINKITLEENLSVDMSQERIHELVVGTGALIDKLVTYLKVGKVTFQDLARLHYIDTGSNTLNHMTRLLIRFVAFLFFYNTYFQSHSTEMKRYRAHFKDYFHDYYDTIIKGSQRLSLEIIFKGGIRPIDEPALFLEYCIGGFMHDIGKLPDINYHDGHEGYDIKKASRHVFDSYNMLLESKEFSNGVISMGLLHHDYYGAPFGYRQLETFRKKFVDRRQADRDKSPIVYVTSYNVLDSAYGAAFSYFPNKMLEILDVYDAMTDKDKKYRKSAYEPETAVQTMRNDFFEVPHMGLDPVLFNIFVDFLQSSGIIYDSGVIDTVKIGKHK